MKRFSWINGLIAIVAAVAGAIYGPGFIGNGTRAVEIIVTVFSILAGFLIAVIAIIGDPSILPSGGWREAELARAVVVDRLRRYRTMFFLYLGTLALAFASTMTEKCPLGVKDWITSGYLFLGIFAFVLSFSLPSSLMKHHIHRIDQEIDIRRRAENIPADGASMDSIDNEDSE